MNSLSRATSVPKARPTPIVLIKSIKTGQAPDRNWERLMTAAQKGDAYAYRTLLAELAVWLRQSSATSEPAMTEDVIQDVLLAIHKKRHTYDPARPLGPWLTAIVRYKQTSRVR